MVRPSIVNAFARPTGTSAVPATSTNRLMRARRVALREPHRPRNAASADGRVIAPHAGDVRRALGTLSVDETVGRDAESRASDDDRVARRTVRAFLVAEAAREVAGIDVAQPRALADLVRAQELRCGR